MKTIYRIENKDGYGPYKTCADSPINSDEWTNYLNNNPDPYNENLYFTSGIHQCGFKTLKQLNKWFSRTELNMLGSLGFYIVKITINPKNKEDYSEGECQIVFDSNIVVEKCKHVKKAA